MPRPPLLGEEAFPACYQDTSLEYLLQLEEREAEKWAGVSFVVAETEQAGDAVAWGGQGTPSSGAPSGGAGASKAVGVKPPLPPNRRAERPCEGTAYGNDSSFVPIRQSLQSSGATGSASGLGRRAPYLNNAESGNVADADATPSPPQTPKSVPIFSDADCSAAQNRLGSTSYRSKSLDPRGSVPPRLNMYGCSSNVSLTPPLPPPGTTYGTSADVSAAVSNIMAGVHSGSGGTLPGSLSPAVPGVYGGSAHVSAAPFHGLAGDTVSAPAAVGALPQCARGAAYESNGIACHGDAGARRPLRHVDSPFLGHRGMRRLAPSPSAPPQQFAQQMTAATVGSAVGSAAAKSPVVGGLGHSPSDPLLASGVRHARFPSPSPSAHVHTKLTPAVTSTTSGSWIASPARPAPRNLDKACPRPPLARGYSPQASNVPVVQNPLFPEWTPVLAAAPQTVAQQPQSQSGCISPYPVGWRLVREATPHAGPLAAPGQQPVPVALPAQSIRPVQELGGAHQARGATLLTHAFGALPNPTGPPPQRPPGARPAAEPSLSSQAGRLTDSQRDLTSTVATVDPAATDTQLIGASIGTDVVETEAVVAGAEEAGLADGGDGGELRPSAEAPVTEEPASPPPVTLDEPASPPPVTPTAVGFYHERQSMRRLSQKPRVSDQKDIGGMAGTPTMASRGVETSPGKSPPQQVASPASHDVRGQRRAGSPSSLRSPSASPSPKRAAPKLSSNACNSSRAWWEVMAQARAHRKEHCPERESQVGDSGKQGV